MSIEIVVLHLHLHYTIFNIYIHSPKSDPNTKNIQTMMYVSIAVNLSAFGIFVVMVLKMLTSTRNTVMSSAILPGTMSGGMRKLNQETMTNMPEGRYQVIM